MFNAYSDADLHEVGGEYRGLMIVIVFKTFTMSKKKHWFKFDYLFILFIYNLANECEKYLSCIDDAVTKLEDYKLSTQDREKEKVIFFIHF